MARSEFRKHLDATQELPADALLGNIVFFTVMDGQYDLEKMTLWFDELNLDARKLPKLSGSFAAFEKACTRALKVAKPYKISADYTGQIMAIRESHKDEQRVVRQLVREVRDTRTNARLQHKVVAELVLYRDVVDPHGRVTRGTHRLKSNLFAGELYDGEQESVQAVIDAWESEFDQLYRFIDGDKLRGVLRDYLTYLNSVMMKPGVYFVHATRQTDLEALATFVDRIGNGCSITLFPVPELKKLREEVIDAFQKEAVRDLQDVVAKITRLRSTRNSITAAAYAQVADEYKRVMAKAGEYQRALKLTQNDTAGAAEVALDSLAALQQDYLAQGSKR